MLFFVFWDAVEGRGDTCWVFFFIIGECLQRSGSVFVVYLKQNILCAEILGVLRWGIKEFLLLLCS